VKPALDRLDSWKEIAAYLKRDVTTVQRWEKREGMPVHRQLHDRMGSVYAFSSELEAWVQSRRLRLEAEEKGLREEPPADERIGIPPIRTSRTRLWLVLSGVAVLALLAVTFVMFRDGTGHATQPKITSLAVLPLDNLSGDPSQEYLADEMTEELCGRLARIHDLRVISRTSVMRFKGTKLSVPEIARMLRVDALVEGSVIRQGSRIRVHAQLIRGSTDEHIWSDEYDGELGDVLALESEVAQSIVRGVEVKVSGEERARLIASHHVSPEVYESYLKAEDELGNGESEKSIASFEETIRMDPSFAPAYVGLASTYSARGQLRAGVPPNEERPKLISAARKALELDPELAVPHILLGETYQRQWQWSEAEAEYKRALELNPNNASAHEHFAMWFLCQGRTDEALKWVQRAHELDPLGGAGRTNGFILFHARRYEEAIRELRSYPDDWYLAFPLIANGQPDEAITVLEKALAVSGRDSATMGVLVRAYAHAGRRADALRLLNELKRRQQKGYVPSAAFVNAYLGLGDNEQAFVWLEKAYQEQSNILELLKVHPHFDPLRGDLRFADLVRRVGLDQPR
jgi:TolB-like protein/Flp pilus assembly protein TadD